MTIAAQLRADERVLGVGIDTASLDDAARGDAAFGSAYLRRVCSAQESAGLPTEPAERIAALTRLWAAKEAATKTLAPRADDPWPWPALEIEPDGAVQLHSRPAELAQHAGIRRLLVLDAGDPSPDRITMLALALGPTTDTTESSPS